MQYNHRFLLYQGSRVNVPKRFYFSKMDPKMAVTYNYYQPVGNIFLYLVIHANLQCFVRIVTYLTLSPKGANPQRV